MRTKLISAALAFALAGCVTTTQAPQTQNARPTATQVSQSANSLDRRRLARVTQAVEPVAEAACRSETRGQNCDFLIVIDDRDPNAPANAYQTVNRDGRPILAFNLRLLATVQNDDELAFIMGHEAAHHIAGHLPRTQSNAVLGAVLLGTIAAAAGAGDAGLRSAQDLGANIGARTYSKGFELEADRLGTVLAAKAGYDPVRGAAYFNRIPDPGNRFLGTHPPNADRINAVRQTAARL